MNFSWNTVRKPIVALAPMAGFTDSAFRQLIKGLDKDIICFTEFTNINAIEFGNDKALKRIIFQEIEQPLIVQIFGNNPEYFINAAKKIEAMGAAGIDINMGCPAKKIVFNSHGSALIKEPKLAAKIVEATKKAVNIPVSLKTRLGFREYDEAKFIKFCKTIESAGADLLTLHGRTVHEGYSGVSNWEPIYMIKEKLKIPVIGNGDIDSVDSAMQKLKNLDGVMIGRGTFGNPWLMAEISAALKGEKYDSPKSIKEKIPLILEHCRLNLESKGEKYGIMEMRKNLGSYIKGFDGASGYRSRLVQVNTLQDVEEIFSEMK